MDQTAAATADQATGTKTKPRIWNPVAAANLSVLLSPILGAWVLARNWGALGQPDRARRSMYWVYAGFAVLALAMLLPAGSSYALWLPFLVVWYLAAARPQMRHVRESLHGEYERKSWKAPVLYALAGMAGLVVVWTATSKLAGSGM